MREMTYVADLERKWQLRKEAAEHARLADVGPYMNVPIEEVADRQFALYKPWFGLGDEALYDRLLCNGVIE